METVTITMKNAPALYLEADTISPDAFAGKTAAQIGELPVFEGNTPSTLGKYFTVAGNAGATAADTKIVVKGDVSKVKYIGFKMTGGELVIDTIVDWVYRRAWSGRLLSEQLDELEFGKFRDEMVQKVPHAEPAGAALPAARPDASRPIRL